MLVNPGFLNQPGWQGVGWARMGMEGACFYPTPDYSCHPMREGEKMLGRHSIALWCTLLRAGSPAGHWLRGSPSDLSMVSATSDFGYLKGMMLENPAQMRVSMGTLGKGRMAQNL